MKRVQIIVRGRVQGVGFRNHTRLEATRLGLVGEVWNNHDGTVGIVAEGDEKKLEELVEWVKRGPDGAEVSEHDAQWDESTDEYTDFRQTG